MAYSSLSLDFLNHLDKNIKKLLQFNAVAKCKIRYKELTATAGESHACVCSINLRDDESIRCFFAGGRLTGDVHCRLRTQGVEGEREVLGSGTLVPTAPISSPYRFTPLSRTASRRLTSVLSFCSFSSRPKQPRQTMLDSPGGRKTVTAPGYTCETTSLNVRLSGAL